MNRIVAGRVVVCLAAALAVAAFLGCSADSDSTGRTDMSGTGTLTTTDRLNVDGSRADVMRFRAARDGVVRVMMERWGADSVIDPFVVAWRGTADNHTTATLIGSDDDGGGCLDAMLVFAVERNTWYSVMFTTSGAGQDLGSYRYSIRELICWPAATAAAPADPDKPVVDPDDKLAR